MTTLEDIMQDLKQIPPQYLEEVRQLVRAWVPKPTPNEVLAAKLGEILSGTDNLSDEEWDAINGHMRKLRAELFTRPRPELGDESNAA